MKRPPEGQGDLFAVEPEPPTVSPDAVEPREVPAASRGRRSVARPTARATDPDTSKAAAASVDVVANEQCRRVLAVILEAHTRSGHGATAHEVVLRLAYDNGGAPQQSVIARRCTDLRDAGLIYDTKDRRAGGTGRRLIVWAPTERAA